jgi:DNA-binding response OmpR family regulator
VRLLLLEDDARLREAYAARFRADGSTVDEAATLDEARSWLARGTYDCLVLDRRVPDGDSVELVEDIDARIDRPPILILSGLGEGGDRLRGLTGGADDYMVKPVHLEELVLRVRKLVVPTTTSTPGPLELGRVTLDREHRHVTLDGAKVHLTPTQYAIFEQMALAVGLLVTKEHLLRHCWDAHRHLGLNPLHSHITRLRRIFDGSLVFESTWGAGYTLRIAADEPEDGSA